MREPTIAKNYAETLLELAQRSGDLRAWGDMLERARREIETEKLRAIGELRREAVDLALAGATKVIEQNLQSDGNRRLVESYLSQIGSLKVTQ